MSEHFCLSNYFINIKIKSRFLILAAFAVFLLVFGFFVFKAEAQVSQFKPGDKNYTAALAAVAAEEAKEDINVEEKVKNDEDFNPEDFGLESVGMLPTNPFYFFKNARRGVTSFFTFNPVKKAERNMQFAAEKLMEVKTLAEREGTETQVITDALENFQGELDKVKSRVENAANSVEGEEAEELSRKVMDSMMKYGKSLSKLEKDLPLEIFDKVKDAQNKNSETFGTVFELMEPEKVSENLAKVLDEQKGSEFKQFKNIEILKDIKDKVPEKGQNAMKIAEENAFLRLQNEMERFDSAKKAIFEDFVRETGGSELRHLEIINELEARPISGDLRGAIAKAKEGVFSKAGDRLSKMPVDQQDNFFESLAKGELQDMRVIKELERNIRPELLSSVTEVRNQMTQNFVKKFDDVEGGGKQEMLDGVERFHDAKSIAILEEIKNLIPDDKKGVFEEIKKKAANEIKRDIDRARNSDQREVIFSSLAGDHPEEAEAMGIFRAEMDKSLRGIFSGVQEAIMKNIQTRVETINDKDRLLKYEEEFNKRENVFKTAAPQNFRTINNFFDDKRVVFESPDKAHQKIEEARKYVNDLRDITNSLPLDSAYQDGKFDQTIRETQRMLQLAERKLDMAETVLGYGDVGRAYGEANAAGQIARDGIRFAQEFKSGKKKVEIQTTSFVPFFEGQTTAQTSVRQGGGFMIYSPYEFSQYCFFVQGFMKGSFACVLRDGRVFNIEGKQFPFEIPPEFVPRKIEAETEGKPVCPALFAPSYDFCHNGKVIYEKDERGCDTTPRCEPFKDQQYQLNLHPTDKSICGGPLKYQCVSGYRCQFPAISDAIDVSGKCVPETEYNTCKAYFTGYVYDSAKRACRQESFSGCNDPFTFHSQSDCERANGIGLKVCPALPTVTDCPAGQRKAVSYSSPECGTYYACEQEKVVSGIIYPYTFANGFVAKDYTSAKTQCLAYPPGSGGGIAAECEAKFGIVYGTVPMPVPEPTTSNWIKKLWYFSDGLQESSYILNRTDAEYQNYLAQIEAKCRTIPKSKFFWKSGSGDDRPENWQNFGIPDCSGTETTTSSCSAPGNCFDSTKCTSSGWYWYNGGCWSSPQSATGTGCGSYVSQSSCTAISGCYWTQTASGGNCQPSSTTGGSGCSQSLIALLGTGCHSMYTDSSGKQVYCDGPMTKSAKEGDTTTTLGCQSGGTSTTARCVYYTQATCDADSICKWVTDRGCGSKAQCNDGLDNDNDGKIDYPADTGCNEAFDNDEAGPTTTTACSTGQYWDTVSNSCKTSTVASACSDGKDNDSDGQIDYPADTGCSGADDNDETAPAPVITIPAAPSGLTHALSGSSATLNWTDNATNETSYEIEKKSSGETSWSPAGSAGAFSGNGTYTVTAPVSSSYEYRVKACNSAGCSTPSNSVTITVAACSSPGNCANSADCSSAGYYWCANANICYSSSSSCSTSTSCSTPSNCLDSAICTSSGWYWYSGGCWSSPQSGTSNSATACTQAGGTWNSSTSYCQMPSTSTTCPSGQYWSGTACVTTTTTSGCGSWMSQSDCTSHTGCAWNGTSNYCYYQ